MPSCSSNSKASRVNETSNFRGDKVPRRNSFNSDRVREASGSMIKQVKVVSPQELRRLFNEINFDQVVSEGKGTMTTRTNRHPTSPKAKKEPFCTKSQTLFYAMPGKRAVAHRYLRPDNTIGASGMPDPKSLEIGEVRYELPEEEDG